MGQKAAGSNGGGGGVTKRIRNLYFELEQMRLNSEKERISTYREMLEGLLHNAKAANPPPKKPLIV